MPKRRKMESQKICNQQDAEKEKITKNRWDQ